MWTRNRVQAAPVIVSKRHLAVAAPQAVVVNAGVANAATGPQGEAAAETTAAAVAAELGLSPEQVVVLSTGVIGVQLPVDKVLAGVRAASLALSPDGGGAAASAILTTDSGPKTAVATTGDFIVGGMAKGAGMIHPCARDDARRRHDRLPARAGRGGDVPPSCRRSGRSTASRSTATARRTTPSSCSPTGRPAALRPQPRRRRALCGGAARRVWRPRAADRRGRRGRDGGARDRRRRRDLG